MARRGYPAEFRRRVIELARSGRPIRQLATDFGISEQTIYTWRHQAQVDDGKAIGLTTAERAELLAMRRRVAELESELAIHRRATELLKGATDPKVGSKPSE